MSKRDDNFRLAEYRQRLDRFRFPNQPHVRVDAASMPNGLDYPVLCGLVNTQWFSYILGLLESFQEEDLFFGSDNDVERAYQSIEAIIASFEACMNYLLRQNPTDPCQLQQSVDGGDTWTLAFDYSLCQPISISDELVLGSTLDLTLEELNLQYDGTAASIDEGLEYDGTELDRYRDAALCLAAKLFVDTIVQAEISRRLNESYENQAEGTLILGIASVVGGLLGAPALILASAVVGVLAAAVNLRVRQIANAILEDTSARDDVACCMYNALRGSTPENAPYQNSLSGCAFAPGSNSELLREAVAEFLTYGDTYLAWLQCVADGYSLAKLGAVNICEGCGAWSKTWLSGNGQIPGDTIVYGSYVPDNYRQLYIGNEESGTCTVWVDFVVPGGAWFTRISFTGNLIQRLFGSRSQEIWAHEDGWWHRIAQLDFVGTGAYTLRWDGLAVFDQIRLIARASTTGSAPYLARIDGVTVYGEGFEPWP